jgi:hypothetical protein
MQLLTAGAYSPGQKVKLAFWALPIFQGSGKLEKTT